MFLTACSIRPSGVYENQVRLFYVRLLDSTKIAIDVGRERMGTDKRPGTIQLSRHGKQRSFSVKDGAGNPVAKIDFVIADDPRGCLFEVARAAATAGMQFRAFPAGAEYVYPGVARIGGPDQSYAGSGEPTSPHGSSAQNRTPLPSTRAPKKARY